MNQRHTNREAEMDNKKGKGRIQVKTTITGDFSLRVPLSWSCTVLEAAKEIQIRVQQLTQDQLGFNPSFAIVKSLFVDKDLLSPIDILEDVIGEGETLLAEVFQGSSEFVQLNADISEIHEIRGPRINEVLDAKLNTECSAMSSNPSAGTNWTLKYQTLHNALSRVPLPRKVVVDKNASLLDLKRAVAKDMSLSFTPDISQKYFLCGSSTEQKLWVLLNTNDEIEMSVPPCQNLHALTQLVVSKKTSDELESVGSEKSTGVAQIKPEAHYLILGGRHFKPNDKKLSIHDALIAQANSKSIHKPNGSPLEVYGPGFLSIDGLSTWHVTLIGKGEEVEDRILSNSEGGIMELDNWLIPGSNSYEETVGDLKLRILRDMLTIESDKSSSSSSSSSSNGRINPSLELELDGLVLQDDLQTLRTSGIKGMSIITVSSKDIEEEVNNSPDSKNVAICKDGVNLLVKYSSKIKSERLLLESEKVRREVLSISFATHAAHSTAESDVLPLSTWTIGDNSLVYVTAYHSESLYPSSFSRYASSSDRFKISAAWESWDITTGTTSKSVGGSYLSSALSLDSTRKDGISTFLSCLFCFTKYLSKNKAVLVRILALLRVLLIDFPPTVLSFRSLCMGLDVADSEKADISQAFFCLMREMLPKNIPDIKIFEHTRIFFTFLLTQKYDSMNIALNSSIGMDLSDKIEAGEGEDEKKQISLDRVEKNIVMLILFVITRMLS
jgi:hypothetical protein